MAEKKQAAPVETVKQPEAIEQTYEVKPNQTTSIVNGNDVLFFGKDVVKIIVVRKGAPMARLARANPQDCRAYPAPRKR